MSSRYKIGIDLGTSNSVVSYVDTLSENPRSEILNIPQLVAERAKDELTSLASFIYLPTEEESELFENPIRSDSTKSYALGEFARVQSAHRAERVISSAKSWLCYGGVDRDAPVLPWGSETISASEKLSPIDASAILLNYFLCVWNETLGSHEEDYRFEKQEIVITVPASFDEAAQRLTLEAAKRAGYPDNVELLEEPQAAFYCWLEQHESSFRAELSERFKQQNTARVLICDVGGGTSDFSLFELDFRSGDTPVITRVAVSDHILLGGDNMDLAVAHFAERKITSAQAEKELSAHQWKHLVAASRNLKERMFSETSGEADYGVAIPSEGSSLFGGSLTARLTHDELQHVLIEGFYPFVDADEVPKKSASGLRAWGLPYAFDSAITRHLAAFLSGRKIDAVLFNGGSLRPQKLRERIQAVLTQWQNAEMPLALETSEMELAVARGAASYLYRRETESAKIQGGYARSVYLQLEGNSRPETLRAICILPQGAVIQQKVLLEGRSFEALVNQPVQFQLYTSTHRPQDAAGDIIEQPQERFHRLPPLQTVLAQETTNRKQQGQQYLKVELEAEVNNLGLLQISCVHSDEQRWALDFSTRAEATPVETVEEQKTSDPLVDEKVLEQGRHLLARYYGKGKKSGQEDSPRKAFSQLEELFELPREEWNTVLCRALWPALEKGITRRARSLLHEVSWLGLAGYTLRPGFGVELDPWRMDQLWRLEQLGMAFPRENQALAQWWILWRRVSAGLNRERQHTLFASAKKQLSKKGADSPELYRFLGTLDELAVEEKSEILKLLFKRISGRRAHGIEHHIWALGRLASRVSLNGKAHTVLPPAALERYLPTLFELDWSKGDLRYLNAAVSQMLRVTGDRARDFSEEIRNEAAHKLRHSRASEEQIRVVQELVEIDSETENRFFGESLPLGIRLQGEEGGQ